MRFTLAMVLGVLWGCAADASGGPALSDEMCTTHAFGESEYIYRVEVGESCDCVDSEDSKCTGVLTCGASSIAFDGAIECDSLEVGGLTYAVVGLDCALMECNERD